MKCHYGEENEYIQSRCSMLREDLKSLKLLKGNVKSDTHVVEISDNGDLYYVESNGCVESHVYYFAKE